MKKLISKLLIVVFALTLVTSIASAQAKGQDTYDKKCAMCHGKDGKGKAAMKTKDFASPEVQKMSVADIKNVITKGSKDGKMKPVAGLTPAQVDEVAAYVKTFKK